MFKKPIVFGAALASILAAAPATVIADGIIAWEGTVTMTNLTCIPWVVAPSGAQTMMWGHLAESSLGSTSHTGFVSLAGVGSTGVATTLTNCALVSWQSPTSWQPGFEAYSPLAPNSQVISINGTPALAFEIGSLRTDVADRQDLNATGWAPIRVTAPLSPDGVALYDEIISMTGGTGNGFIDMAAFFPISGDGSTYGVFGMQGTLIFESALVGTEDSECCCTPHSTPGCSTAACSASVCAVNPDCCITAWDSVCASLATTLCGTLCTTDCDGVAGADACYLGAAQTAHDGSGGAAFLWESSSAWTSGVPGLRTIAQLAGTATLECDHAVGGLLFDGAPGVGGICLNGHTLEVSGDATVRSATSVRVGACTGSGSPTGGTLHVGALTIGDGTSNFGATLTLANCSLLVDGALRLRRSATLAIDSDFSASLIQCNQLEFEWLYWGQQELLIGSGSAITALGVERVTSRGALRNQGSISVGGELESLNYCDATGTWVTPFFENGGTIGATLGAGSPLSMHISGDFSNHAQSAACSDPPGMISVTACCGATTGGTPILDISGTASLGGILRIDATAGSAPGPIRLLTAGTVASNRSGFDSVVIENPAANTQQLRPVFNWGFGSDDRPFLELTVVPAVPLAFTPDPPTTLFWRPIGVTNIDIDSDGDDDVSAIMINTLTGASQVRVYENLAGVVSPSYMDFALPALATGQCVGNVDGVSGSELIVLDSAGGLWAIKRIGGSLVGAVPSVSVTIPKGMTEFAAVAFQRNGAGGAGHVVVAARNPTSLSPRSVVQVLEPTLGTTWLASETITVSGIATTLATGDLDRDGIDEVLVGCQRDSVETNESLGLLHSVQTAIGGGNPIVETQDVAGIPVRVVAKPIDEDAFPDVVVANSQPQSVVVGHTPPPANLPITVRASLQVFRNAGEQLPGGFVSSTPMDAGSTMLDLVAVDPDGDGDIDLATISSEAGRGVVKYIRNDSSGFMMVLAMAVTDTSIADGMCLTSARLAGARVSDLYVCKRNGTSHLGPEFDGLGQHGEAQFAPADLNHDGAVNGADLTTLFSAWGPNSGPADINGDGVVDGVDMTTVLSGWAP